MYCSITPGLYAVQSLGTRPREPDESSAQSDLRCSLELNHTMLVSSSQRRTGPPTEPGFSQGFFSPFLSPMKFWFLAAVAFGLLSWGRLTDCTDTIGRVLNWMMTSLKHQRTGISWKMTLCYCPHALLTNLFPV